MDSIDNFETWLRGLESSPENDYLLSIVESIKKLACQRNILYATIMGWPEEEIERQFSNDHQWEAEPQMLAARQRIHQLQDLAKQAIGGNNATDSRSPEQKDRGTDSAVSDRPNVLHEPEPSREVEVSEICWCKGRTPGTNHYVKCQYHKHTDGSTCECAATVCTCGHGDYRKSNWHTGDCPLHTHFFKNRKCLTCDTILSDGVYYQS